MKIRALVYLLLILLSSKTSGQIYKLETDNLVLIYPSKIHDYLVPHLGRCFENALQYHREFFDYHSQERITVFMQDFWDYGNAGATAIPENYIRIGIAPLNYTFETSPANERINHTMNHELVHIVTSDKAAASDNRYRKLFQGKVMATPEDPLSMFYSYLTNPRRYSPRWYNEGIAVFMETWMAGGIGRAMGPYDEMVFRTMVLDSSYIYDVVGLESEGTTIDFQVGVNSYLYGTRFMNYLAYQYKPEKLIDWVSETENRKRYFASHFKKVYGISLDEEWSQWISWEKQFQKSNLDSIKVYPTTEFRPVSKTALGSVSAAYYDRDLNQIFLALLYPGKAAQIAALDLSSGSIEKICEIEGAGLYYVTSLTYDPFSKTIFYTTDNTSWRDLNRVDIRTGKTEKLMEDLRTGDLAFNQKDQSLWGIRHYNGISTIVRIARPYREWDQVYSWPYGKDLYDIDISPDGRYLTGALAESSGRQLLIKMNIDSLRQENPVYDILFDFEISNPAGFVFSSDGRYLFGSSYYSGVSNIYRYDVVQDDIDIISNCETGFFRPLPVSEDSLITFRYTGQGFLPVMIANQRIERVGAITFLGNEIVKKHPVVKSWILESPHSINLDSLTTAQGQYHQFRSIHLNSLYPIVEGYKDFPAFGLRTDWSDYLGIARFNLNVSYAPNRNLPGDERFHAKLNFYYWNWEIFSSYNGADFYDLFGPTKTSRKGYSLGFRYKKTLVYNKPRLVDFNIYGAGYGGLETLPDYQNIAASFDKSVSFGGRLNNSYLIRTMGSVDDEKGWAWQIASHNNYIEVDFIPFVYTNFDWGFLTPLPHSSLWFRSSLGHSFGDRDEPFANFYFGGFGNNWIDHQEIKRYRKYYSFPGVEINEIGGKNYAKLMAEWTLPPLRFRRIGFTSLYLRWARLAFFSSGIVTNLDDEASRRQLINIGGQLDFRLVTFSLLKSTLSFGYAVAFEENSKASGEFMISFKIL